MDGDQWLRMFWHWQRELPNVVTLHPGELPLAEDGIHTNAEGQIKLGEIAASAVEEFYLGPGEPER